MTEARQKEAWNHTALIAALIRNSTASKQKDCVDAFHFHPFRVELEAESKAKKEEQLKIKQPIQILQCFLSKSEQRRLKKEAAEK